MANTFGSRTRQWLRAALVATVAICAQAASAAEPDKSQPQKRSFSELLRDLEKASEDQERPEPPTPEPAPEPPAPEPKTPANQPPAPPAKAPAKQPSPPDREHTSDDPAFGTTAAHPVRLGLPREQGRAGSEFLAGVKAERSFLRRLRDRKGRPFRFRRLGSVAGEDGHPVDRFELTDGDGQRHRLYLDMYHPESPPAEAKAPKGMVLWDGDAEEGDRE